MQHFICGNCGQLLYFDNTRCEHCGNSIGLMERGDELVALSTGVGKVFVFEQGVYEYCANHAFGVCNWLVPLEGGNVFCKACALNRIIPNVGDAVYRTYWTRIESAKHRLVYSLMRLRLPIAGQINDPVKGLRFNFVAESPGIKVFTGHDNGLITINIAEADDIQREMTRLDMHEPYRTLLGHFRHEIGHYYWDVLIRDGGRLASCREVFGDDSIDYGWALERHYREGPPADWSELYISAYASMHPWEDWAECWAHYMHIMDTMETAYAYDMRIRPRISPTDTMAAAVTFDPYEEPSFDRIIGQWLPLTFAMNGLNQSMGVGVLYPFVITPLVMKKLSYIHWVCMSVRG